MSPRYPPSTSLQFFSSLNVSARAKGSAESELLGPCSVAWRHALSQYDDQDPLRASHKTDVITKKKAFRESPLQMKRSPPALKDSSVRRDTALFSPPAIVSCERLTGGPFPLWEATSGRNPGVRHSIGEGNLVKWAGGPLRPCGKWRGPVAGPTWGRDRRREKEEKGSGNGRVHGGYPVRWAGGCWILSRRGWFRCPTYSDVSYTRFFFDEEDLGRKQR